jgi:hypothetical protein
MANVLIGTRIKGNGGDGIKVETSNPVDLVIIGSDISENGGHGVNYKDNIQALHAAGIRAETPQEQLKQAFEELLRSKATTEQEQLTVFERIGFTKYLSYGANIATICSLLFQIFNK